MITARTTPRPGSGPVTRQRGLAGLGSALGLALLVLAGCGDNGSSSGSGSASSGYSLSGTILMAETAAVDSDLNDVNQASRTRNDDLGHAQALATPVLLDGTVNRPGAGPAGASQGGAGDPDDFFKVDLQAGQVIELEFAAATTLADLDLYISDSTGTQVGASSGAETRFECVQAARAGTYYVNVYAFKGASIYTLRIGAIGTAGTCGNVAASLAGDGSQLLARPLAQGDAAFTTLGSTGRAAGKQTQGVAQRLGLTASATHTAPGPQVLTLPADAHRRRAMADTLQALHAGLRAGEVSADQALGQLAAQQAAETARTRLVSKRLASAAGTPDALDGVDAALATLRSVKALHASGAYAYVQPNWLFRATALTGSFPPGDPDYGSQSWHYDQINLSAALNTLNALPVQPALRPIVAVIDSGVVLDHPDLAPQLLSTGCLFVSGNVGCNGNGTTGRNGDSLETASSGTEFHGTHVAGTVAAAAFNGTFGTGVAPMAQILPLNVFGTNTGASSLDIVQAMLYAAGKTNSSGTLPARRADVINLSLGGGGSCAPVFQEAVNTARSANVMVVAATGNDGRNSSNPATNQPAPVGQPANCSGVIAVSATTPAGTLATYANTGSAVVLAAPGGSGAGSNGVFSTVASFVGATRTPGMASMQGTSMATPHVAGVLALMRYVNPALTVAQVDDLIAAGALSTDLGAAGRDSSFGWGLVSASKAVNAALGASTSAPPPSGQIVAQPSAFDLGGLQTRAVLNLTSTGTTSDTVAGVVSSNPAVLGVAATAVDGAGLGSYTLSINRSSLGAGSSTALSLTVTLAPSGTVMTIPVTVAKPAASAVHAGASFGPVYVLLVDADTQATLDTQLVQAVNGRYTYQLRGIAAGRNVSILAGTDLDNDDLIYQPGEVGGAYSSASSVSDVSGSRIVVNNSMSQLDFQIAPLSGLPTLSLGNAPAVRPHLRGAAR